MSSAFWRARNGFRFYFLFKVKCQQQKLNSNTIEPTKQKAERRQKGAINFSVSGAIEQKHTCKLAAERMHQIF